MTSSKAVGQINNTVVNTFGTEAVRNPITVYKVPETSVSTVNYFDVQPLINLDNILFSEYIKHKTPKNPEIEKMLKTIPGIVNNNAPDLEYNDAVTFMGRTYYKVTLTDNLNVFKAGGNEWYGRYFSLDKPVSELQVRIDKAILPVWPGSEKRSVINHGYELIIPKGNTVYIGETAPQGGIYLGGTPQIFMLDTRNKGIEVINKYPLQQ